MEKQQLFETEPARLMMAFASMCKEHKKYGEFYNSASFFGSAWLFSYQLQSLLFILVTRTYIQGCNGFLEIM
jgi:hypothetical protein